MSRKKSDISKDFSIRLLSLMNDLGFIEGQRSKFANKIGITPSFLSDVINLKSGPSFGLVSGISKAFPGVDITNLLTGRNTEAQKGGDSLSILYKEGGDEEDPEVARLLNGARKVLTSGNKQAFDALSKNIDYFTHAVEMERRLSKNESDISLIKDSLLTENEGLKYQNRLLEASLAALEKKLANASAQPEKVSVNG